MLSLVVLASAQTNHTKMPDNVFWVVSDNGNLIRFANQIGGHDGSSGQEGYAICDSQGFGEYYDTGLYNSGNWGPSVVTWPNGQGKLPVVIARPTADGSYILTQKFTYTPNSKNGIRIAMTLDSKVFGTRTLVRYADVVQPVNQNPQQGGTTFTTAFIWAVESSGIMASSYAHYSGTAIVSGGVPNLCHPEGQFNADLGTLLKWQTSSKSKTTVVVDYSWLF
jgi:hypothetical protein